MALADGTPLLNKFDCPLFSLSRTILSVDSTNILAAVSFVHECDEDVERNMQITQEREEIDMPKLVFEHNWSNVLFCYNIYCIQEITNELSRTNIFSDPWYQLYKARLVSGLLRPRYDPYTVWRGPVSYDELQ